MDRLDDQGFAPLHRLRERYTFWLQGVGTLDQVYAAARRAGEARLEVIVPPTDHVSTGLRSDPHGRREGPDLSQQFVARNRQGK